MNHLKTFEIFQTNQQLEINENFNDILNKVKSMSAKGILTSAILASILSSSNLSADQKNMIKEISIENTIEIPKNSNIITSEYLNNNLATILIKTNIQEEYHTGAEDWKKFVKQNLNFNKSRAIILYYKDDGIPRHDPTINGKDARGEYYFIVLSKKIDINEVFGNTNEVYYQTYSEDSNSNTYLLKSHNCISPQNKVQVFGKKMKEVCKNISKL